MESDYSNNERVDLEKRPFKGGQLIAAFVSTSRHSVLRGGGRVRVRDTRKRSHLEVHYTQLRRGIRVGRFLGGKRRFDLQADQRLRYYCFRPLSFLHLAPSSPHDKLAEVKVQSGTW